jgi:hypothetical protein
MIERSKHNFCSFGMSKQLSFTYKTDFCSLLVFTFFALMLIPSDSTGPLSPISREPTPTNSVYSYSSSDDRSVDHRIIPGLYGTFPLERCPSPFDSDSDGERPPRRPPVVHPPWIKYHKPPLDPDRKSPPIGPFTYPPPDPSDPTWLSTMYTGLEHQRKKMSEELEDAKAEAAAAIVEVTLVQGELEEEVKACQALLDMVAKIAGVAVVRQIGEHARAKVEAPHDDSDKEESVESDSHSGSKQCSETSETDYEIPRAESDSDGEGDKQNDNANKSSSDDDDDTPPDPPSIKSKIGKFFSRIPSVFGKKKSRPSAPAVRSNSVQSLKYVPQFVLPQILLLTVASRSGYRPHAWPPWLVATQRIRKRARTPSEASYDDQGPSQDGEGSRRAKRPRHAVDSASTARTIRPSNPRKRRREHDADSDGDVSNVDDDQDDFQRKKKRLAKRVKRTAGACVDTRTSSTRPNSDASFSHLDLQVNEHASASSIASAPLNQRGTAPSPEAVDRGITLPSPPPFAHDDGPATIIPENPQNVEPAPEEEEEQERVELDKLEAELRRGSSEPVQPEAGPSRPLLRRRVPMLQRERRIVRYTDSGGLEEIVAEDQPEYQAERRRIMARIEQQRKQREEEQEREREREQEQEQGQSSP